MTEVRYKVTVKNATGKNISRIGRAFPAGAQATIEVTRQELRTLRASGLAFVNVKEGTLEAITRTVEVGGEVGLSGDVAPEVGEAFTADEETVERMKKEKKNGVS